MGDWGYIYSLTWFHTGEQYWVHVCTIFPRDFTSTNNFRTMLLQDSDLLIFFRKVNYLRGLEKKYKDDVIGKTPKAPAY